MTFTDTHNDIRSNDVKTISKNLKRTKQEFEALFNQSNDGIIIVRKGVFINCNNRISEMFGYSKSMFIKNTPLDLSPEYQPSGRKSLDGIGAKIQAAMKGEVQEFYWKHKRNNGELFDTDVTVCRFDIEENIYLQIIVRDTTELRMAKEAVDKKVKELERYIASNNELQQFAHTTAHDLKEPLRTIGSFAGLLDRTTRSQLDSESVQYLDFITKGVSNMTNLIQDLLEYCRASAQDQQAFKLVDPNKIVGLIVQHNLRQQIQENQAVINFDQLPATLKVIKPKFSQLLQNLLSNAMKFSQKGRPCRINISVKTLEKVYLFEVADNGIGIVKENLDKIFEVFTRLHSKHEYEGSGIGLATCKKIVQQHGGKIWVTSVFGEGSTFSFTIPKH